MAELSIKAGEFYRVDKIVKQAIAEPEWTDKAFAEELAANRIRLSEA